MIKKIFFLALILSPLAFSNCAKGPLSSYATESEIVYADHGPQCFEGMLCKDGEASGDCFDPAGFYNNDQGEVCVKE